MWAIAKLQTLQNDCLRACEKILDPRGVNVDALHTRLNVTTLKTSRDRQLLSHIQKWALDHQNSTVPPRLLRGNMNVKLKPTRVKKDIYAKSPMHRGQALWDTLESDVQHMADTRKFAEALKKGHIN